MNAARRESGELRVSQGESRSAIVVKPRQPFLDWLHTADPTSHRLTLRDLTREPTIYLIPECDTAISRVGINRLPRSPLRCRPTCQFHFSLATRWRTIHPGLHVNLPILGR